MHYSYCGMGLSVGTMIAGWDEMVYSSSKSVLFSSCLTCSLSSWEPGLYYVDGEGGSLKVTHFSVGSGSPYKLMVFWIAVIAMRRHLRKLLNWHVGPSSMQHFTMELVFFMSGLMVGRSFLEMMLVSFTASIILSSQPLLCKKWLKLHLRDQPY